MVATLVFDGYPLPPATKEAGGGGGGGDRDILQASKGSLPRSAMEQFAPPTVVLRNNDPKLPVESSVVLPPHIEMPRAAQLGDPRLLRRLVRNLLDNASRHGAPPIDVQVRRAGDAAELRVCDQGPGIPPAEHEAVFHPFHRSRGADDGRGAGLGLALVRQIARQHGGDARYAPGEPAGSCFVVRLAR